MADVYFDRCPDRGRWYGGMATHLDDLYRRRNRCMDGFLLASRICGRPSRTLRAERPNRREKGKIPANQASYNPVASLIGW